MKRFLLAAAVVLFSVPVMAQHPRMMRPHFSGGNWYNNPSRFSQPYYGYQNRQYNSATSFTPFGAYSYGNGPFGQFNQTTTFTPFGSYSYGSGVPSYGPGYGAFGGGFGGGY